MPSDHHIALIHNMRIFSFIFLCCMFALPVFVSVAMANDVACIGEEDLTEGQKLFMKWGFSGEGRHNYTFKHMEDPKESPFHAIFFDIKPWNFLDRIFFMQYFSHSRTHNFNYTYIPKFGLKNLKKTIQSSRKRTRKGDLNLFFLFESEGVDLGPAFQNQLIQTIRGSEKRLITNTDVFDLSESCRILRGTNNFEVVQTISHMLGRTSQREKAACIMTTFLVHFGLSNAREIFRSPKLLAPDKDKFLANFAYLPLGALYSVPNIGKGVSRCDAVDRLLTVNERRDQKR